MEQSGGERPVSTGEPAEAIEGERRAAGADPLALVNTVAEVLAWVKPDGTFVFVSDAARSLYGREPADLVGTQALDLIDPADRAEATRRLEALAAVEGREERMTVRIVRGDGTRVWADTTGRLVRVPETGELLIAMVAREANERVETRQALARVEERFRELIEWLPAVVYEAEVGADGRFLYISPQVEEMFGYSAAEWVADATLWRERLHPDEVARVLALEREQELESIKREARLTSEYRMVHRSGRDIWVRDIARVCVDSERKPFWRGVLTDITAERSARLALADAHERHRGMVDALPACSYRAERRAMGRWHFVSAQIEPLLGYTPAEWCADPTLWRASLHTDDRDRLEVEEQRQMNAPAGTEFVSEYRLRHRSGRVVAVRDRAILTRDDDGAAMIDGILTDISAERAAEAAAFGDADVYRLSCGDCGASWAADRVERCHNCRSQNVECVSLNSTINDLAGSRRQVEGLLDGIQKHLEALGTNLRTVSTRVRSAPGDSGQR